jgi:hypothetical protein
MAIEVFNAANQIFASVSDTVVMQKYRVLHSSRCFVDSTLFEDVLWMGRGRFLKV